jgi:23S rRNA (uracil1939-C5)-methyltransferase
MEVVLDVEKPAAGGRMVARHEGRVVLVWGAVPGERVRARIERVGKGVAYAETLDVLQASPDRRGIDVDWRCGGGVYSFVAYERQVQLKAEIIGDAFGRIGRLTVPRPPMMASPAHGYRMRARLHARGGRIGFFREGSHDICDAGATGQLLPETVAWLATVEETLRRERLTGLVALELAENVDASQRACHLELAPGEPSAPYGVLAADGALTGLSAQSQDFRHADLLAGAADVSDVLVLRDGDAPPTLRLTRNARAFFQGNRFLLEPLVRHVLAQVPEGPVVDLYAGVGLFGLAVAASGGTHVTLVEGDPTSGADLERNAAPFAGRTSVVRRSVEAFLTSVARREHSPAPRSDTRPSLSGSTVIVDPPRTGMSREALEGVIQCAPGRLVYVSCDTATLARDARKLVDAGYAIDGLTGIDLFPNTAHVESVAVFVRSPLP